MARLPGVAEAMASRTSKAREIERRAFFLNLRQRAFIKHLSKLMEQIGNLPLGCNESGRLGKLPDEVDNYPINCR